MKKKYIWLIEIIVWLLISVFGFIYKTAVKSNAQNIYYLFVDDANGLVKGSNVRLMGIDIGYIRQIKIFDNKVFVSFLVTRKDLSLPKCATANISFYGLGGSTSLELTPKIPTSDDINEEIIPSKAYRVQDFWDGQKLTAEVMINIYGAIGRTINSTKLVENKQYLKQNSLLEKIITKTDDINKSQTVFIYKLSENTLNYEPKETIQELETEVKEDE